AFVAADDGNVVSISLDDGRERGRCQIPGAPDVVFFNPLWSELNVAIGDPGLLVTIDTQQMRVSETTATALGAHTFAFDPDRQRLYSLWPDLHQVVVFATQEVPA
ncbi:MAG: YncE family protein, partial [Sulfobacillus sp.]